MIVGLNSHGECIEENGYEDGTLEVVVVGNKLQYFAKSAPEHEQTVGVLGGATLSTRNGRCHRRGASREVTTAAEDTRTAVSLLVVRVVVCMVPVVTVLVAAVRFPVVQVLLLLSGATPGRPSRELFGFDCTGDLVLVAHEGRRVPANSAL